ncbi:MAG TPA: glutathione S-transferase family protein [Candidatus Polarisedimenticolaceae bacterium]|nr:glutathione S-transferase family protein [Candidatus Polarisedimenticolaceae bacterium]
MTDSPERVLFLTPLSHFSRKVRIVLREIGLAHAETFVPDLLSADPADFGGNPILRVPVLRDGTTWVIESDQIARHVLETYDRGADRFAFFSMDVAQRNALSIVSAVMGAEVELLLSKRSGLETGTRYFQRYREVVARGLAWLEGNAGAIWPDVRFSYLDIALICMWDHLGHYRFREEARAFPWIEARTKRHASRESVAATSPERMQALQWELYPSQRPS